MRTRKRERVGRSQRGMRRKQENVHDSASTKSHILHNIPFRVIRKAVRSVDRLLGRHWLFQERRLLEVVRTPTPISPAWIGRG
jgi:hypothetical protein